MSEDLLYEIHDGIGRITFNRPQARNAFTFHMYERLAEICQQAEKDNLARVLVLTGAGEKAFASGTDISQFQSFSTPQDALEYEERIDRVLGTLERCAVPTIAAIAGACTGGGFGIASCCDLRLCASNARFGYPVGRTLGNCLSGATCARLAALLGPALVKDIVFTARLMNAAEAQTAGLVSEVAPDHAALQSRADELARHVAGMAPLTLRATKEALRRIKDKALPQDDHDLILMCYMSRDFQEGMRAFLDKRPPKWTGA